MSLEEDEDEEREARDQEHIANWETGDGLSRVAPYRPDEPLRN